MVVVTPPGPETLQGLRGKCNGSLLCWGQSPQPHRHWRSWDRGRASGYLGSGRGLQDLYLLGGSPPYQTEQMSKESTQTAGQTWPDSGAAGPVPDGWQGGGRDSQRARRDLAWLFSSWPPLRSHCPRLRQHPLEGCAGGTHPVGGPPPPSSLSVTLTGSLHGGPFPGGHTRAVQPRTDTVHALSRHG